MGYGSIDKPVPWLGPQQRIVEVHWPTDKFISVSTSVQQDLTQVQGGTGIATIELTEGLRLGINYVSKHYIAYSPPPQKPWPPYPPPRSFGARPTKPGQDAEIQDQLQGSDYSITGWPDLPGTTVKEFGAWTEFRTRYFPLKPDGEYVDVKIDPGSIGRYRKGTSFTFQLYAQTFTGTLGYYGPFVGSAPGFQGRLLSSDPTREKSLVKKGGTVSIDFSSTILTFKKNNYKVVGRWVYGPYEPQDRELQFPPAHSLQLLFEKQKRKTPPT